MRTYVSSINRLKKVDKHLDYGPISNYLKSLPVNTATSVLSALIVLEGRERFGRLYDSFVEDNEKMRGHQRFSNAELKNWTSSKEIKEGIQRIRFEGRAHSTAESAPPPSPPMPVCIPRQRARGLALR